MNHLWEHKFNSAGRPLPEPPLVLTDSDHLLTCAGYLATSFFALFCFAKTCFAKPILLWFFLALQSSAAQLRLPFSKPNPRLW